MVAAPASVLITILVLNDLLATFVTYYLVICLVIPVCITLFVKKKSFGEHLKDIGLGRIKRPEIVVGLSHGLIFALAIFLGFFIFNDQYRSLSITSTIEGWGIAGEHSGHLLIFMIMVNGISEELFWRGYLHTEFSRMRNRPLAILVTSLFYASYHLYLISFFRGNYFLFVLFMLAILVAGYGWGLMREYYGNSYAPAIGHFIATIGYMCIYWYFLK